MIGLETNVLARYFVEEADADAATQRQREAARQLIESGQNLFLPKTVALELEWVTPVAAPATRSPRLTIVVLPGASASSTCRRVWWCRSRLLFPLPQLNGMSSQRPAVPHAPPAPPARGAQSTRTERLQQPLGGADQIELQGGDELGAHLGGSSGGHGHHDPLSANRRTPITPAARLSWRTKLARRAPSRWASSR